MNNNQTIQPMIPEVIKAKIDAEYPIKNGLPHIVGSLTNKINRRVAEYGFTLAMAVEFAEWIQKENITYYYGDGTWQRSMHAERLSTSELYQTFLNQNEGK